MLPTHRGVTDSLGICNKWKKMQEALSHMCEAAKVLRAEMEGSR